MHLPSSKLHEPYRSAVRFTVVGSTGSAIQYGIYMGFLLLFEHIWPEQEFANIAFTLGFLIEMVSNYFLTAYYTFGSKPNFKNLGGFLTGRVVNYPIQIGGLNLFLWLTLSEAVAGFLAIVVAGIVNYFVVRLFFNRKPKSSESANETEV